MRILLLWTRKYVETFILIKDNVTFYCSK